MTSSGDRGDGEGSGRGRGERLLDDGEMVSYSDFVRLMCWLHPLAISLRVSEQWTRTTPVVIHLMDKDEAAKLLRDSRAEAVSITVAPLCCYAHHSSTIVIAPSL
jgi:hypothetical protein